MHSMVVLSYAWMIALMRLEFRGSGMIVIVIPFDRRVMKFYDT